MCQFLHGIKIPKGASAARYFWTDNLMSGILIMIPKLAVFKK